MFGMASVILIIPTWSALKNHVWRMTRHDFCSYIIVLPLLSLLHTWWKKEVFGCGLVQTRHIFLALYTWSTPTFMYTIWVFQLYICIIVYCRESSFYDLLLHHLAAHHFLHNSADNLDFGFILFYYGLVIDFEG